MNKNTNAVLGLVLLLLSIPVRWGERKYFTENFLVAFYGPGRVEQGNYPVLGAWWNYMTQTPWGWFFWAVWFAMFAGGLYYIFRAIKLSRRPRRGTMAGDGNRL